MENLSHEKIILQCDRSLLTLLGLIIGHNLEKLIEHYKVKVKFSPETISEFKNIVNQMQQAIFEEDFRLN